jgi:malonate-semialdehyde dehydrogenase (acetylating) / methylmalonate-semialdehyde dehydrogenase
MSSAMTHWIGGQPVSGPPDGPFGDVMDPATGRRSGTVPYAGEEMVDAAAAAARKAFKDFRHTSSAHRAQIMFRFRELVVSRKDELAALITAEHGKVLSDALGEISRGLEIVELACGVTSILRGEHSQQASTSIDVHSFRQPLGVVGIITPFNFPAMVPMWFFPLAIAAGNTVVLKPSEKNPSAAIWLTRRFEEAGLPPGVLNVVHGDARAVDAILDHPDVAAVSFVGSTPVARHVHERATRNGKRVQALGGAKNHMVVLPDADLDLAADAAVSAGFGSAGERCMAISVVVVVGSTGDALVNRIVERMATLVTGDGRRACDMGPLVTAAHRDRVAGYLDAGLAAGARLVVDGRDLAGIDGDPGGFWLRPTLFDDVTPDMSIYTDEIFGPVLSVVRVPSYEAALALVNSHPSGNGAAVFTNDGGAARRFQMEVEVGMVGINVPIPVPVANFAFGGWKSSLFGDLHAYGADGIHFYTRGKVVTSRWLDPSHGGVDLGFPRSQ